MESAEKVLTAMKEAGVPLNAGKLVELTGLERKEVDKAMKTLLDIIEGKDTDRMQAFLKKVRKNIE